MTAATVDLTAAGSSGTIGGAAFTTQQTKAGTGIFNTFVELQRNGVEQGYNTNASAQYDEKGSHQFNHSILLADVPTFVGDGTGGTIEGLVYREFRFDGNETNGGLNPLLSLDKLQIWQEESGSLTNFTPGAGFAGAHTNYLAYDLDAGGDHWVAINAGLSSGSGKGDMRVFIPDSYFINDAAHRYVTLYSELGLQGGGYAASGGFEEWGLNSTTAGSGNTPSFLMSKTATVPGGTADAPGEMISYTIKLTNVGDMALTSVTLTDPLLQGAHGTLGAPTESMSANGVLDVGETWTYGGTYTVQQSDLDSFGNGDGTISNTATADTAQTTAQSASATVPLEFRPSIGLVKSAVGGSYDDANGNGRPDAGETIHYGFTVSNTGNVTMHDASVSDLVGGVAVSGTTIATLAPAQSDSTSFTGVYTVTQADIDAGLFANTADASAFDPLSVEFHASASQTVVLPQHPHLTVEKTGTFVDSNENGFANPGELIQYVFTVTNDGNVTLDNAALSDTALGGTVSGPDSGDTDGDGKLDVGETWIYSANHTVTQADVDAGNVHNVASATATGPQGQPASDTAASDTEMPQNPHLTIDKSGTWQDGGSEPNGYADAGETIHYTFAVTNDGNVTLSNLAINDTLLFGPLAGPASGDTDSDGKLDVGETWIYAADYTIKQADVDAGGVHNVATATAQGPQAQAVSGADSADVTLPKPPQGEPGIELHKVGTFNDENHDGFADVGETISYVFTVVNTGAVALHNIGVTDANDGTVAVSGSTILSLAPGASDSNYTGLYTITQTDINAGFFENTAVAVADEASDPDTVTVMLLSHAQGSLLA